MRFFRAFFDFLKSMYLHCDLLWDMTKRDFKQRYIGSTLGILWAFIQPAVTVLIFWFVFQIGFKSMPVEGFPFLLWLICGMFPWFFFSDALNGATNAICANSFLVKKIVFRVSLLPVIQILSALLVNCFFTALLFLLFALYGYPLSIYNLQIVYYLFALVCLVFGLSLITASLMVFLKDIGQIVAMCLQFGFWATPIFWNIQIIPQRYQTFIKCNPMYYIIEGYRNSFIYHEWFWNLGMTNYSFWIITGIVLFAGLAIFKKLKPHFADVL